MKRRRFITAATATAVTVAGCTSPEDDDGTETGGGAYGKVDGDARPASS